MHAQTGRSAAACSSQFLASHDSPDGLAAASGAWLYAGALARAGGALQHPGCAETKPTHGRAALPQTLTAWPRAACRRSGSTAIGTCSAPWPAAPRTWHCLGCGLMAVYVMPQRAVCGLAVLMWCCFQHCGAARRTRRALTAAATLLCSPPPPPRPPNAGPQAPHHVWPRARPAAALWAF